MTPVHFPAEEKFLCFSINILPVLVTNGAQLMLTLDGLEKSDKQKEGNAPTLAHEAALVTVSLSAVSRSYKERRQSDGVPIMVRIRKGANQTVYQLWISRPGTVRYCTYKYST